MTLLFPFTFETCHGIELARWIGDREVTGWQRIDLWGDRTPPFVADHAMFGGAGILRGIG